MVQPVNKTPSCKSKDPEVLSTDPIGEKLSLPATFPHVNGGLMPLSNAKLGESTSDLLIMLREALILDGRMSDKPNSIQNTTPEEQIEDEPSEVKQSKALSSDPIGEKLSPPATFPHLNGRLMPLSNAKLGESKNDLLITLREALISDGRMSDKSNSIQNTTPEEQIEDEPSEAKKPKALSTDSIGERLSPPAIFPRLNGKLMGLSKVQPSESNLPTNPQEALTADGKASIKSASTQNTTPEEPVKDEPSKAKKPEVMKRKKEQREKVRLLANPHNAVKHKTEYREALIITRGK